MPYKIKKVKGGYKVILLSDPTRVFSKNPQTKEMAEKQIRAIYKYEEEPLEGGAGQGKTGVFGLPDYA